MGECVACGKSLSLLDFKYKLGDGCLVCGSCAKEIGIHNKTVAHAFDYSIIKSHLKAKEARLRSEEADRKAKETEQIKQEEIKAEAQKAKEEAKEEARRAALKDKGIKREVLLKKTIHYDPRIIDAIRCIYDFHSTDINVLKVALELDETRVKHILDQLVAAEVLDDFLGKPTPRLFIAKESIEAVCQGLKNVMRDYATRNNLPVAYEEKGYLGREEVVNKRFEQIIFRVNRNGAEISGHNLKNAGDYFRNNELKNYVITNATDNDILTIAAAVTYWGELSNKVNVYINDTYSSHDFDIFKDMACVQEIHLGKEQIKEYIDVDISDEFRCQKSGLLDDRYTFFLFTEIYGFIDGKFMDSIMPLLLNHGEHGISGIFFTSTDKAKISNKQLFDLCEFLSANSFVSKLVGKRIKNVSENLDESTLPSYAYADNKKGVMFEEYCMKLLETNGFTDVRSTKASGDHGIDIFAEQFGIKFAIQCKCYEGKVGNSAIQEAYSGRAFYGCDIAVVMTNSEFTVQAVEEAEKLGVKLWGKEKIAEMIR